MGVGTDYYHRGRINLRREGKGKRRGGGRTAQEAGKRNCSHDSRTNASLGVGEGKGKEWRTKKNGAAAGGTKKGTQKTTFVWAVAFDVCQRCNLAGHLITIGHIVKSVREAE